MDEDNGAAHFATFSDALSDYLATSKLSRPALAHLAKLSAASVKNWADGTSEPRDWESIIRMAEVMKLDSGQINVLLKLANHPPLAQLMAQQHTAELQELLFRCAPKLRRMAQPDLQTIAARQLLDRLPERDLPVPKPFPAGSRVAYRPDDRLTGRDAVLRALATECKKLNPRIIALTGMGGIGKTRLAGECARRFGAYFAGGVFWVNCGDEHAVAGEVAACGGAEGLGLYMVAEQTIAIRHHCQPPDDPAQLESREILGLILQMSGGYTQAHALYRQILAARLRVLGAGHMQTGQTYNNLGCLLMYAGGDYRAARRWLALGTRVIRRTCGRGHAVAARCWRNLGYVTMRLGHYGRAQRYLEYALAIFAAIQAHDPTAHQLPQAQTVMYQGELAMLTGAYDRATVLHEQALAIRRQVRRADDSEIAASLWHLGRVALAQGQLDSADAYLTQALTMAEHTLMPDHIYERIRILESLGELRLAQGRLAEAAAYLERTRLAWEGTFKGEHPEGAKTELLMGQLAQATGQVAQAQRAFAQAAARYAAALGTNHPLTREAQTRLAAAASATRGGAPGE